MDLNFLATGLIIGNFFILTGFFITIILVLRYSMVVSQQLNETKQKLQDQEKKIQSLQTTITSLDILSALTNSSLYYSPNYGQTPSSSKKPTTPKPSLSVLKSDNKNDEQT